MTTGMRWTLNWFWRLHDIFLNFISFVFLFHCLPQFRLHPPSGVTPSLSLACFILHACFGFITVSTHYLLYHFLPRCLSPSYEFQNDVLILTRKPEAEKRLGWHSGSIWVLTSGLEVSGLKYFFLCVWSSTTYLWMSYFLISHCCAFETGSVWNLQNCKQNIREILIQQLLCHLRQSGTSRNKKKKWLFFFPPVHI